ncbi:transcriptional regulator [Halococcus salsus]|uniref:HVO_A0114 family putative DNA-binding protein n=1 Tax=Halococcus salsus TaxID=2162894 RepID=UPI00135AEE8B|nr:transcriptional regulator [Halococcus salsus]
MVNTGPNDGNDSARTMHIRFGRGNTDRVEETLAALDRDETPEPYFERVYRDEDDLHRVTRPKNLELLRTLASARPESIRETARLVERDVRHVHRNLTELADLGLVEFETNGRSKRPRVWYDEIAVELELTTDDDAETSETVEA